MIEIKQLENRFTQIGMGPEGWATFQERPDYLMLTQLHIMAALPIHNTKLDDVSKRAVILLANQILSEPLEKLATELEKLELIKGESRK